MVAARFADELREALELRAWPQTDAEYSLLAAIETMATFGCSLADEAYRLGAVGETHRDEIRRAVCGYVVASAIVDHICDHAPGMAALLQRRLSMTSLESVLMGTAESSTLAVDGAPPLFAYLDETFQRTVCSCRALLRASGADGDGLWPTIVSELVNAYGTQLATASPDGVRDVEAIWATPFWLAVGLVAVSTDGRADVDLNALQRDARSFGSLLALIDDVMDVEEDWTSGSGNQLLERSGYGPRSTRGPDIPPWEALCEQAVCGPYMEEIANRARALSGQIDRHGVAAWLHYWLGA